MSKVSKLISKYKIDYLSLSLIMAVYYGHWQWSYFMSDPDAFYHAKIAVWLSQGKMIDSLPWMQFSTLRDNFTDHQLLYHLLLVPFVKIFDPLVGAKIASVVFAVAMVLVFYWLIKKMSVPWPWLFALGFLTLSGLSFRLSLVKTNSLSLLIIFLIIYSLFYQKYWLSALLGFAFVWLYGGWPLALPILAAYIISEKISRQLSTNRLKIFFYKKIHLSDPWIKQHHFWKSSFFLLGGLLAGVIINPYWPHNIYFYFQQFIQIGVVNMGEQFTVGNEWYKAGFYEIIAANPILFFLAVIMMAVLLFKIKKISRLTWWSFFMACGFFFLTHKSKRYVEYYMPFALLLVASTSKDLLGAIEWKKWLNKWHQLSRSLKIHLLSTALFTVLLIMPIIYDNMLSIDIPKRYEMNKFKEASEWLIKNTPPNSTVFHSDWDEWPMLFYFNDYNYYIIGLDPTFMENYDSKLHRRFRDLTLGYISYQPSKYIKTEFRAQYIFVDKEGHNRFISNLSLDQGVTKIYEDANTLIYKIIQ